MAIYRNTSLDSPIACVEFSPVSDGNSTFFKLKPGADAQAVKRWLTTDLGQQIEAEAPSGNQTYLVTRGDKTKEEIAKGLKDHGVQLIEPEPPKAQFKPWIWRGNISIAGQGLQLASGLMAAKLTDDAKARGIKKAIQSVNPTDFVKKGMDAPVVTFAVSNLLANFVNIIFGAQKSPDTHQLNYLKKTTNQIITPYLPSDGSATLPGIHEQRATLRSDPPAPRTIGQKVYDFMKRNSVTVGEIGLRYFGAFSLAFPVENWKKSASKIGQGAIKEGFKEAFNKDKFSGWTGVAYLAGKSIALFSKVPDPYNEKHKHTWVDTVREKYLFRVSSGTEAVAAGLLAYNGLTQKKIFYKDKLQSRDWPGGIGGLLFMSGLVIRMFAPFGTRELNHKELTAHITDGLAQVPVDKLPQATAAAAAFLTDHFKDKKAEFGKIYTELATDLYRYHNIAMPGVVEAGTSPVLQASAAQPEPAQQQEGFARPELKKLNMAPVPRSFQDMAAANDGSLRQRA
jgi:hypothetical protein